MTQPSASQSEKKIDENICTAIIYSIPDIGEYLVEIRHQSQKYYIQNNDNPTRFANLADAKKAARKHNATQAFLALSNVYAETEAQTSGMSPPQDANKFEYLPEEL